MRLSDRALEDFERLSTVSTESTGTVCPLSSECQTSREHPSQKVERRRVGLKLRSHGTQVTVRLRMPSPRSRIDSQGLVGALQAGGAVKGWRDRELEEFFSECFRTISTETCSSIASSRKVTIRAILTALIF